ncbi:outer membrane protein/peptidoglycan-associated (lipo)protein [Thiovulum sp. ES]|nr:outer membrane protein/peptidoglycan-associated (lipo)protein [Thiovulum sp. ES]
MFYSFLISIFLLFAGCGDDAIPNPAVSENNETEEDFIIGDENETLETDVLNDDLIAEAMDMETNTTEENPALQLVDDTTEGVNTIFESLFFNFDSFQLSEEMMTLLKKNIEIMEKERLQKKGIIIEGNCDEWGTDEYNYALGLKRAKVIQEVLIIEGIPKDRIRIVSYGESNPMCLEDNSECRSKNRRVDFKLEDKYEKD